MRTVKYSQTTITELMIPSYANFGGKIHGGILLSMMDKVAYATASKHGPYPPNQAVNATATKNVAKGTRSCSSSSNRNRAQAAIPTNRTAMI